MGLEGTEEKKKYRRIKHLNCYQKIKERERGKDAKTSFIPQHLLPEGKEYKIFILPLPSCIQSLKPPCKNVKHSLIPSWSHSSDCDQRVNDSSRNHINSAFLSFTNLLLQTFFPPRIKQFFRRKCLR